MTDPIITKNKPDFRILSSTPTGWQGLPEGAGWIIDSNEPARPSDAPGVTKPNAFIAGVYLSRARTVWTGSAVLGTSNIVYRDIDFYDYMRVTATGVQFINCGFYGGTAWPTIDTPLVDCTLGTDTAVTTLDPWAGVPYFEDCTFKPRRENYYTDGITGSYRLFRCKFRSCRNGAIVNSTSDTKRARVKIESSYFHQFVYWYQIPGNIPGGTVNYAVDIRCAGDIVIRGNTLRATVHAGDDRNFNDPDTAALPGGNVSKRNPLYPDQLLQPNGPHANGAPIRVNQTRTIPFDGGTVIEKNWLSKGMIGAELLHNGAYVFSDNKFERNGFYSRSTAGLQYYIKLSTSGGSNISGLNTNKFEDDNSLLTTANGGIQ